jgi:uncharacterized membrane protein YeiB
MNIVAFAWPEEAYDNPTRGGGFSGLDLGPAEWVWRSLTYWRLQPMVRRTEPLAA